MLAIQVEGIVIFQHRGLAESSPVHSSTENWQGQMAHVAWKQETSELRECWVEASSTNPPAFVNRFVQVNPGSRHVLINDKAHASFISIFPTLSPVPHP